MTEEKPKTTRRRTTKKTETAVTEEKPKTTRRRTTKNTEAAAKAVK